MTAIERPVAVSDGVRVTSLWLQPKRPRAAVVVAHGAGADMHHPFMCLVHEGLAAAGFTSVKFNFPYTEAGRKRPDPAPLLEATWRALLEEVRRRAPGLAVVAAGKSLGGRMASRIAAESVAMDALVLLGYPLHAPGRSERVRDEHFARIQVPSLFVQGTRDTLCDLELLRRALKKVSGPSTLHVIAGGDHSFRVLKRSGRAQAEVDAELVQTCSAWIGKTLGV